MRSRKPSLSIPSTFRCISSKAFSLRCTTDFSSAFTSELSVCSCVANHAFQSSFRSLGLFSTFCSTFFCFIQSKKFPLSLENIKMYLRKSAFLVTLLRTGTSTADTSKDDHEYGSRTIQTCELPNCQTAISNPFPKASELILQIQRSLFPARCGMANTSPLLQDFGLSISIETSEPTSRSSSTSVLDVNLSRCTKSAGFGLPCFSSCSNRLPPKGMLNGSSIGPCSGCSSCCPITQSRRLKKKSQRETSPVGAGSLQKTPSRGFTKRIDGMIQIRQTLPPSFRSSFWA